MTFDETMGVDVLTSAVLEFGRGVAAFTVTTRAETDQRVHVYGTEGRISVGIPFNIPWTGRPKCSSPRAAIRLRRAGHRDDHVRHDRPLHGAGRAVRARGPGRGAGADPGRGLDRQHAGDRRDPPARSSSLAGVNGAPSSRSTVSWSSRSYGWPRAARARRSSSSASSPAARSGVHGPSSGETDPSSASICASPGSWSAFQRSAFSLRIRYVRMHPRANSRPRSPRSGTRASKCLLFLLVPHVLEELHEEERGFLGFAEPNRRSWSYRPGIWSFRSMWNSLPIDHACAT